MESQVVVVLTILLLILTSSSSSSSSSLGSLCNDRIGLNSENKSHGDSPCTNDVATSGPSIKSITSSPYLLDVTIFSDSDSNSSKTYKFEATIFDFEFDRDVYVETFDGSYAYSNVTETFFAPNTEMMTINCDSGNNNELSRKKRKKRRHLNDPHLDADWRVVPETQSVENWIHSTIFEVRKNMKPKLSSQHFSASILESVEYDNRILRNPFMTEEKNCTQSRIYILSLNIEFAYKHHTHNRIQTIPIQVR